MARLAADRHSLAELKPAVRTSSLRAEEMRLAMTKRSASIPWAALRGSETISDQLQLRPDWTSGGELRSDANPGGELRADWTAGGGAPWRPLALVNQLRACPPERALLDSLWHGIANRDFRDVTSREDRDTNMDDSGGGKLCGADAVFSAATANRSLLSQFVAANEDPGSSPNLRSAQRDDFGQLLQVLGELTRRRDRNHSVAVLKALKILSRKESNRLQFNATGISTLVHFLRSEIYFPVAAECCNVLLNICYDKQNVDLVLAAGGTDPLISFAEAPDVELQANAAGTLQSICFQDSGRTHLRLRCFIPRLIPLLSSSSIKVQMRVAGAVHNLSSDPEAIHIIRCCNAIPLLTGLLRAPSAAICSSVAGTTQNLSREEASRVLLSQSGAVPPLADLLFGSDVQCAVCAAGALLNILGPDLGGPQGVGSGAADRRALRKLLTMSLVLGMTYGTLFGDRVSEREGVAYCTQ